MTIQLIDVYDKQTDKFYKLAYEVQQDGSLIPVISGSGLTDVGVVLSASELHLGEVGGRTTTVSTEFTRENNATPYSIGDVISGSAGTPSVYELPNLLRINGGSGLVANLSVIFNVKSVTPTLRVNFFNSSTPAMSGDNLPYREAYSDCSKHLGYMDLPAMSTAADLANTDMSKAMVGMSSCIPLKAAPNSRSIWFSLQLIGGTLTLTELSKVTVVCVVLND